MATFLELVKQTAQKSGTMPSYASITNVEGQTGRVNMFVDWVRQAYVDIQNKRDDWRWMTANFSGNLIGASDTYMFSDLGIERFSHWIHPNDGNLHFSLYDPAVGRTDEGYLTQYEWGDFHRMFEFGTEAGQTGRPERITVNPQDYIVVHPMPAQTYTLRGRYYKSPQQLAVNGDVPEVPSRYHDLIVWRALYHMCTYDEAFNQIQLFERDYQDLMRELVNKQTPEVTLAGPLA